MKKALCVGISRFRDPYISPLAGSANDVALMVGMLQQHFGFMPEHCTSLVDECATKAAILNGLERLVAGLSGDDIVVFSIATHGSWKIVYRREGRGPVAIKKVFFTYDCSESNVLFEDEVCALLNEVPRGATCYYVIDTCSAGTPGATLLVRGLETCNPRCDANTLHSVYDGSTVAGSDPINRVVLSGCADDERSLDVPTTEGNHGLLTISLYETLEKRSWSVPVGEAYDEIRRRVGALANMWDLKQTPQLCCPQQLMKTNLFR
jgi:hypothetical protein